MPVILVQSHFIVPTLIMSSFDVSAWFVSCSGWGGLTFSAGSTDDCLSRIFAFTYRSHAHGPWNNLILPTPHLSAADYNVTSPEFGRHTSLNRAHQAMPLVKTSIALSSHCEVWPQESRATMEGSVPPRLFSSLAATKVRSTAYSWEIWALTWFKSIKYATSLLCWSSFHNLEAETG